MWKIIAAKMFHNCKEMLTGKWEKENEWTLGNL